MEKPLIWETKHQQDRLFLLKHVFLSHGAAKTLASSEGMDWSVRAQQECQAAAQHSEGKLDGVTMTVHCSRHFLLKMYTHQLSIIHTIHDSKLSLFYEE